MAVEHCLQIPAVAPAADATVIIIPPLFDEANRLRRTLVLTMRALAAHGLASCLPDWPGQNESTVETAAVTLADWRRALANWAIEVDRPFIVASWRGGALIDDAAAGAAGWWRMAPVGGATLIKTMVRTRIASEREAGRSITADAILAQAHNGPVELAGNRLNAAMIEQLEAAKAISVSPLRERSVGSGEQALPGSALWLRAEPGEDRTMAQAMADDIAQWTRQCVGI